jgi:hypothetical protein
MVLAAFNGAVMLLCAPSHLSATVVMLSIGVMAAADEQFQAVTVRYALPHL